MIVVENPELNQKATLAQFVEDPDERFLVKHLNFVQEFLQTGNATEAYIRVHPEVPREEAKTMGSRLVRDRRIAPYVRNAIKDALTILEVAPHYLLAKLKSVVESQEAPWATRVRAIELLGKHQGMFQPVVNINNNSQIIVEEINYTQVQIKKDENNNSLPVSPARLSASDIL